MLGYANSDLNVVFNIGKLGIWNRSKRQKINNEEILMVHSVSFFLFDFTYSESKPVFVVLVRVLNVVVGEEYVQHGSSLF